MKIVLVLAIVLLSSCRTDNPPNITLCKLSPAADAHCVDTAGTRSYRNFPKLVGSIMLSEEDARKFGKWCYGPKSKLESQVLDSRFDDIFMSLY